MQKLREAADSGHAGAAFELAQAYSQGLGVEPDIRQADAWLDRAAELGEPRALFLIGASYDAGTAGERAPETAAHYYGEAALLGHVDAQYALAEAFAKGDGVDKNLSWALRWYGKAAYQGHGLAQFSYGVLMASGRGLPKDPKRGYRWLLLSEKAGVAEAAAPRAALEKQLAAGERQAAAAWVADFRPRRGDALLDPPTVQFVQYQLSRLGYRPGPVDGLMGRRTAAAIDRFQGDQGREGTGQLTSQVLEDLLAESRRQAN